MSAVDKEAARRAEENLLTSEPRKLWQSIEEKQASTELLHQVRGQEFKKLPKDQVASKDLNRRDFFKWVGGASALFATACQQRPERHLVPYVNKPAGFVYGQPVWYSSVSSGGQGLLVKTREGRPIKLEGNPDHELNQGALDVHAQSEILNLYNPERLTAPIDPKSGKRLDWREISERLMPALRQARAGGVRLLTSPVRSPSLQDSLDVFTKKYRARHDTFSAVDYSAIARAHEIVEGTRRIPYLNFEKADVVLSVDADFLGSWLRPVDFTKQFSKRRRVHEDDLNVNQSFCFESMMTVTGISSDFRFPIKPSMQLDVLLTFINELSSTLRFDSAIRERAAGRSAESLAKRLGIDASEIHRAVEALRGARGRSLVVAGVSGPQSVELQLACVALNDALGNYGNTVLWERSIKELTSSPVSFDQLISDALRGEVDVLILQGVNPAYARVSSDFEQALSKIPLVVSVGYELDETARLAHIAIGESHFLECWGDDESVEGYFAIQQPTIEPLFQTKSMGELLLEWSEVAAVDYRLHVKDFWRKRAGAANFESWWQEKLKAGFWRTSVGTGSRFSPRWLSAAAVLQAAEKQDQSTGVELVAYSSIPMGDGRFANNAWRQELPDPVTKVTWTNAALVSPAFAKKHSIERGSILKIQNANRSLEIPAYVQPGMRDDVIALALGYGRESSGSIGKGVGKNAFIFAGRSTSGEWMFAGTPVEASATGGHYELACTQDEFQLHGRDFDILQKTNLEDFKKDPKSAKEGKEIHNFSIYGENEYVYPGHRWGMAIDLNKCTGCQACVVACYAENNVAVVGEDQVRRGRHLAWLRLDLYYEGDELRPDANFEPMLCQHCERAPCETVCPVLATVHSSDGLNDMAYNRCVGTRYCANNCPYKVRRFNYFFYSDKLAGKIEVSEESPLSLMLNPDVTVRGRGVMEKCSFCVQRIRKTVGALGAQDPAKLEDGAIKTACQQTCPADAITFGDLNNTQHQVTKLADKAQAFKVLEVLNSRPAISYLPRVRNKG